MLARPLTLRTLLVQWWVSLNALSSDAALLRGVRGLRAAPGLDVDPGCPVALGLLDRRPLRRAALVGLGLEE